MKINNRGWGYSTFIMCLVFITAFVFIANHFAHVLMGVINL